MAKSQGNLAMPKTSRFLTLIALLALLVLPEVNASHAGQRVLGYDQFTFGMTRQEISKQVNLIFHSKDEDGNWYKSSKDIVVLGDSYVFKFKFHEDVLIQMNITHKFDIEMSDCQSKFFDAFAALKAKYGDPDQPVQTSEMKDVGAIYSVRFTGADGSYIEEFVHFSRACLLNVGYVSGKKGKEF